MRPSKRCDRSVNIAMIRSTIVSSTGSSKRGTGRAMENNPQLSELVHRKTWAGGMPADGPLDGAEHGTIDKNNEL